MICSGKYKNELHDYVENNVKLFQSFENTNIIITGAAGLIGSYMADLLIIANDVLGIHCRVYAVDIDGERLNQRFPNRYENVVKCLTLDINSDALPIGSADFIIHAASNTSPLDYATKPVDTIRTNIIGTDRLIQYARQFGAKRFLFCSSVEAYGQNNGDTDDFTETYSGYVDCNTLRAGYPSAKRCSEALCNAYAAQDPVFDFVIARIGRIYGPTIIEGDAKAPSQFINNAVAGDNIVMKSNGMQQYSYAYVGDCAIALFFVLLYGSKGEAYNVADPNAKILLKQFAEYCALAGGSEVVYEAPTAIEQKGYSKITKATMNTEKLTGLGWKAQYPTKEGIERTVQYIREIRGGSGCRS